MESARQGRLELITGCMYSGKSEELIRRVQMAMIAKFAVQVFKPAIDDRYGASKVSSHNGLSIDATAVTSSAQLLAAVDCDTSVVAIDEIQFLDPGIVEVVLAITKSGRRVICAGLDLDFRREPFGSVPQLLNLAEDVVKLTAICVICGQAATMSQRLVDGKPAKWTDPIILVGAEEKYEARCRECHSIERPP